MYAFGAMLSFTDRAPRGDRACGCASPTATRPYRGPGNARIARARAPLFAVLGGIGTGDRVRRRHRRCTSRSRSPAWAGCCSACVVYVALPPPPGPRPDDDRQGRDPAAGRRPRGRVRLGARRLRRARATTPEVIATAVKLAARRRRGIHVLVTITVPELAARSTPRCPSRRRSAQAIIEQAKLQGGRRVSGHCEKVRAGQAGRRIVEEAREMRARGDRACRCRSARGGASLFGKTLETVLAERPVPGDHRVRRPRGRSGRRARDGLSRGRRSTPSR